MQTGAIVRCAAPEWNALREILFSRYPELEWATFARFGWRETKEQLVVTLAAIDPPSGSDLDDRVRHVAISELVQPANGPRCRKTLAGRWRDPFPPRKLPTYSQVSSTTIWTPITSSYLEGFAPDRPYISLIVSMVRGELSLGGRVFWRGQWLPVQHFAVERTPLTTWTSQQEGKSVMDRRGNERDV